MKAGFIGLGQLGTAMVKRLSNEGVELTVWNRTPEKVRGLDVASAVSPAGVFDHNKVALLCLFDSGAVRDVLTMPGGLLEGDCEGALIIDMTTNHFGEVGEFYRLCKEKGATYVEAPVLGSVVPASQGKLTIVVSGDKSGFEQAQPYLEKLGKDIFFVETPGMASKMKVINNLTLGSFMATVAESLALAEKAGIPKEQALDILAAGAGSSAVLNAKKKKLLDEDFSPHFTVALIDKDLRCLQDLTAELKYKSQIAEAVRAGFSRGLADERKQLDFSAIYKIYKEE